MENGKIKSVQGRESNPHPSAYRAGATSRADESGHDRRPHEAGTRTMIQLKLRWWLCFYFILIGVPMILQLIVGQKVHVPGDIILGGLVPIHQKGGRTKCGAINKDRGIQRLEAMLFALDRINRDTNLLNGIKVGAIILDTCSSDSYALNQSLEFIRSSVNTIDPSAFKCADGSTPKQNFSNKAITGVIGGSYSEVTLRVANLLRLFRIPQISPASTGTSLSDKSRYDFFARTVPSDMFQALAMVDVVQMFNWSYVSMVSSEGQYGDSGMNAFHKEARARNICIAVNEKVPHVSTPETFDTIYKNLLTKGNAKGVVLFTRAEDSRGVLEAAKRANDGVPLMWVASDGWGTQEKLVEGLEEVAEGAITVELQSKEVEEFDEYMKNLTPINNKRNPWFEDYWESVFSCVLPHNVKDNSTPVCSPHLRLDETVGYRQESKVQFVIDAVYAMAHALHALWKDVCEPRGELYCDAMRDYDGGDLYTNYLLNVSFRDLSSETGLSVYLGIMRCLREAVRLKRPERWQNNDWILHVGNARPHTAHVVLQFLAKHSTIQIPHPPYSPDLAPNDFFLYSKLKMNLKGRKFDNVDMIQAESKATLRNLSKSDFISCFDNWKKIWNGCIETGGAYFEKY
ncbi:GRM3 [Cordylochernes scorpioides]|uniref:GRM3 n=1 Tax=Cordylochernes scorpioides TaxID=51811 RepID=A0ABY6KSQ4_9ARAC|nr:GRM3 [Cordylochernes scorpioides]